MRNKRSPHRPDRAGAGRAAHARVRPERRPAGLHQHAGRRRRPDLYAQPANPAAADLAVLPAGRLADDDELHPHHHRAVAAAPGDGHPVVAAEPGADRAVAVPDPVRDGSHLRQDLRRGVSAAVRKPHPDGRSAGQGRRAAARVHAQADARNRPRPVRQNVGHGAAENRRRRADARAHSRLHHQRTENRVPDRLCRFHSLPHHRHGGRQHPDGDGHDDGVAGHRRAAVQDHPVRAGRRLESVAGFAGAKLLLTENRSAAMTPESVMTIGRTALEITILVASPVLLVTLVAGLIISIFQAATQINDASLSFIPKVIAVLITFAIAGPWMLTVMTDYMRRVLTGLPGIIS